MGVIHRALEYYSLEIIPAHRQRLSESDHHDRLQGLWGKMHVQIEAVSEVFVGTGDYETDGHGIYAPFSRANDQPVIPGTCIKGVVRSYAEALSPSCVSSDQRDVCRRGKLCICCRIFGALGFLGRVTFCDAKVPDAAAIHLNKYSMAVRRSGGFSGGRRFYRHNSPGPRMTNPRTRQPMPKERVEVVPEGTRFLFELLFHNLTQQELGLLLLAMGISPQKRFDLKLGGGKNRRLGRVRFSLPDGIEVTRDAYTSFDIRPETKRLDDWGQQAIVAYLQSLDSQQRKAVLDNLAAFQVDPLDPPPPLSPRGHW